MFANDNTDEDWNGGPQQSTSRQSRGRWRHQGRQSEAPEPRTGSSRPCWWRHQTGGGHAGVWQSKRSRPQTSATPTAQVPRMRSLIVFQTRKICRPSANVLCGRPLHLWPFELKLGTIHACVCVFSDVAIETIKLTYWLSYLLTDTVRTDRRTDGRTGTTPTA